jgi:hypothetical protein
MATRAATVMATSLVGCGADRANETHYFAAVRGRHSRCNQRTRQEPDLRQG